METPADPAQLIAEQGLDAPADAPGNGAVGDAAESLQETIVLTDQPAVRGPAHAGRTWDTPR